LRLAKQSQFIPLQNAVYFITLPFLVRKILTFYIDDVILLNAQFHGQRVKVFWSNILSAPTGQLLYETYRLVPKVMDTTVKVCCFTDQGCHVSGSRGFEVWSTQTGGCGYSKIFIFPSDDPTTVVRIVWTHRVCQEPRAKLRIAFLSCEA